MYRICIFGGFREIAFASRHKHDSSQHRNISRNPKQFNIQLERLMMASYSTKRYTICMDSPEVLSVEV